MEPNKLRAKIQSARQKCTDIFKAEDIPEDVRGDVQSARNLLELALGRLPKVTP